MGAHECLEQRWSHYAINETIAQGKVRHCDAATQEILGHEAEYLLVGTPRRISRASCADHWLSCRADAKVKVSDLADIRNTALS